MKQNVKNDSGVGRVFEQLAAEKKKAGIALCLIAVMAVMWVKVLMKKGPEGSQAAPIVQNTDVERQSDDAAKITYVDLPQVSGRDDLISRDFFASAGWQDFGANDRKDYRVDIEEVSVNPTDRSKEVVAIVAQHLKLDAIGMGQRPQAFINDKLLSVGDKLAVTDGNEMYECEVIEIEKNSVLIRCRETEIVLKLVQTAEGDG